MAEGKNHYMVKTGSVLLMLGGLWALGNIIGVNVEQMAGYGQTYWQQLIYGSNAAAVDIVGVFALTALAAWLCKEGKWVKGAGTYIVVALAAAFSLQMYYGFSAATRWKPAEEASRRYTAEVNAGEQAKLLSQQRQDEHLAYLREEASKAETKAANRRLSRTERAAARDQRQAAYDAQGQVAFGEVTVKAAPIKEITDPAAESIANDLGWQSDTVQKLQGIYVAIVMMLIHIVAVSGSIAMWPRLPPQAVLAEPAIEPAGTEQPPGQPKLQLFAGGGEPEPDNDDVPMDIGDGVEEAVTRLREKGGGGSLASAAARAEAACFFTEATVSAPDRVPVRDMYNAYVEWAHESGLVPMGIISFGSCVTAFAREGLFGISRIKRNGGARYVSGRRLTSATANATPLFAAA